MAYPILDLVDQAPEKVKCQFSFKDYKSGANIISANGRVSCCLYIICSGIAEVQKETTYGTAIVVNVFNQGDVFGEVEIFSPDCKPYDVYAKTDCKIIVINKETVFQWMREVFDFDLFLCEMLTRRMYVTSDSMSRIALLPIKERVLGCIWTHYSNHTLPWLTKMDLVSQVRAPLRSVNRVVRTCIEEGTIEYRKKTFSVKDVSELEKIAILYNI